MMHKLRKPPNMDLIRTHANNAYSYEPEEIQDYAATDKYAFQHG